MCRWALRLRLPAGTSSRRRGTRAPTTSRESSPRYDRRRPENRQTKEGREAPEATPSAIADAFDEAAETKRITDALVAADREKYDKACARVNASNMRFMERASSFAMFMALRGQDVQMTISPVQQGFKEMFGGGGPLQLGAGDPELFDDQGGDDE